jgi:hypothetical protein
MRRQRYSITAAAFLCLILGSAGAAHAGSVFLKNGYILQGRIVERGEGVVVLGWQNGRVTIHDRFIDEVLLDPSEEEMIRRRKELEAVEAERSAVEMENLDLASNEVISLPDSYESILGGGAVGIATTDDPGGAEPTGVPIQPIGTGETPSDAGIDRIPNPSPEEKFFPALGVALKVPEGWRVDERVDSIRVGSDEDPKQVCLTVDLWRGKGIVAADALQVIRESLAAGFPQVTVEDGPDREIGRKTAKTLACHDPARGVQCRQNVVECAAGVFVLGSYLPANADASTALALEDLLDSMRFLSE